MIVAYDTRAEASFRVHRYGDHEIMITRHRLVDGKSKQLGDLRFHVDIALQIADAIVDRAEEWAVIDADQE